MSNFLLGLAMGALILSALTCATQGQAVAMGTSSGANVGLKITDVRTSADALVVRVHISNPASYPIYFVADTAKQGWPNLPFVWADDGGKVLHAQIVVAECPKDRRIEVPYAYRFERLNAGTATEKDIRIPIPVYENHPYWQHKNDQPIPVKGQLGVLRTSIGILRADSKDKATETYIGCGSELKKRGYEVISSDASLSR